MHFPSAALLTSFLAALVLELKIGATDSYYENRRKTLSVTPQGYPRYTL
jgi:hypothetical protein